MNILRLGETTHESDFRVLREKGYPYYLLLLVETPAEFEVDGAWVRTPAHTAFLFRPAQRHSYRALGGQYTDCWMHIESARPLLFAEFPFGRPIPLLAAARFYGLFRILADEFFSAQRTKESVTGMLSSALIEMIAAEVEVKSPLFYPFLALREQVFRTPARPWNAERAAKELRVSDGYFHVTYKKFFRTTFTADVIAARIQAAEELLLSTPDSVERIAERCGYLNVEHFIRQFRRAAGVTPLRFRRQREGTPR